MPIYYVWSTKLPETTAEVDAPDKRTSKRTFFRYLRQSGAIPKGSGEIYKKTIKADNKEPEDSPAKISLSYSPIRSVNESVANVANQSTIPILPQSQQPIQIAQTISPEPQYIEQEQSPPSTVFSQSPIMNISKQSGGK